MNEVNETVRNRDTESLASISYLPTLGDLGKLRYLTVFVEFQKYIYLSYGALNKGYGRS